MPFTGLPRAFARLRGRNERVMEFDALVSPGSDYSLLPKVDAYRLGYPEAARDDIVTEPANLVRGVTYNGYWEGMMIKIKEVEVATRRVADVEFVAFDVPQASTFDVVLGRGVLSSLGISIDYRSSLVRLPELDDAEAGSKAALLAGAKDTAGDGERRP